MARPDTTKLRSFLDQARHVTLLLPQNPNFDAVASALALKIALETSGKGVNVACSDEMTVEFNRLVGVETVSTAFGSRNLVISFPGQTENVDKVSYNLDKGELQLVITPKVGAPDLNYHRLKFVPGTASTDVILLIGVNQLVNLGPLYNDARDLLANTKLVSFTRDLPHENYTPHQIYDPEASSLSELMAHVVDSLGLNFNTDVATNLLTGIETATRNFQSPLVGYATFESAAHLLRRGARRDQPLSAHDFPPGAIPSAPPPPTPAESLPPPPANPPSSQRGYGTDSSNQASSQDAPQDWYEPKIYRGPMLQ